MLGRAERRAHDVGGGARPVRVAVHRLVDHQMARQHLAEHAQALVARAGDHLHRILGRHVHDVHRHTQHLRDADRAIGGLALHLGRARQRMRLRPGDAVREQLALELEDQLAVFRVHGRQCAQLQ